MNGRDVVVMVGGICSCEVWTWFLPVSWYVNVSDWVRWEKNKAAIPALIVWLGVNLAVMNGTSEWNERSRVFAMLV